MAGKYTAVALYSGGLDSTVAPIKAREKLGHDILLLMIDLGESEAKRQEARRRAGVLGMDFTVIDGRQEFAADFLSEAIRMNGSYWGYPLITPLSRAFMMKKAFVYLNEQMAEARHIVHGCTIYQNTRFRIEKHCSLGHDVVPVGPLVGELLSREDKIKILQDNGIDTETGSDRWR